MNTYIITLIYSINNKNSLFPNQAVLAEHILLSK